jgi:ribosomal protein L11 methyltransferase
VIEFSLSVPPAQIDAFDDLLLENGDDRWSLAQDLPTAAARLFGFFADRAEGERAWSALVAQFPLFAAAGQPAIRELPEQAWRDSYKIHFKAWKFGRLHWVPIWERESYVVPPGDAVLWLDPGLAFGTGNHETTRLCVERLVELADKFRVPSSAFRNSENPKPETQNPELSLGRLRVIDAGCGSGILALSAALLGFTPIAGFDNDPEAVRISEENAALNELSGQVEFFVGDLVSGLARRSADILLANIQADVLQRFVGELTRTVAPGGTLILSGILAKELDQVRSTFAAAVPTWLVDSRTLGEWSDLSLRRP